MDRRAGEDTAEPPDVTGTSATEEAARPVAAPSTGAAPRAGGRIIRWDRFLPWRFLRVLLVEHDDSTRQIVTVLLKKCSYQVVAVADGLRAWTILKEGHYKVDLVLTEVMTPSLSGIDLLSKIMGNDVCKNLPVIMMSSHDSMGIVFNCMLKGAADFLVKPVRKNELRNLWQHVWRRRCSGSSGNCFGNEIPGPGRIGAISDNNIASNRMSINSDNSLKTGQSCEKGSDTQSSCGQSDTPSRGLEGLPHETEDKSLHDEAQLHASKPDLKSEKEYAASTIHLVDDDTSKSFEQKVSLPSQATSSSKQVQGSKSGDESAFILENAGSTSCKEGSNDPEFDNDLNDGCSKEVIDFVVGTTGQQKHECEGPDNVSRVAGLLVGEEQFLSQNENAPKVVAKPCWELPLRRPLFGSLDEQEFQHKHVLNHSNASAFSRYGDKGNHHGYMRNCDSDRQFDANVGPVDFACKAIIKSPEGSACEAVASCQHGKGENLGFCVVGPSVDDSDSSCRITKEVVCPHAQVGVVPLPIPVGAIPFNGLCTSYGALLQPIFYSESGLAWHHPIDKKVMEKYDVKHAYYGELHAEHEHHSDDHNQGLVEQEVAQDSAIVVGGIPSSATGLARNASSRSDPTDYGSNHNVEDGSAAADNGANFGTNNVDIFEASNSTMMDHDRSTHREAALTKFRLKRKNRCFEKRVRYYSRKKLAEQRPRLKGQFVRQTVSETKKKGAISDE
ncbi:two-component response regulator-like APRR3 [Nymphaea colorata]|nr:two-component response regulator-like APRR3 [Nymphaea colorata]